jgi:WD40 repeat protein
MGSKVSYTKSLTNDKRQKYTCFICCKILKNPLLLPCSCSQSVCKDHVNNGSLTPKSIIKCSKCLTEFDVNLRRDEFKPNLVLINDDDYYSYCLSGHDKKFKKKLEKLLSDLDELQVNLSKRVASFRIAQELHFHFIRNLIERSILEVSTAGQMMRQVNESEMGFEQNFTRITDTYDQMDIDGERKTIKELFYFDCSTLKSAIKDEEAKLESQRRLVQENFDDFKIFEFDLKQNELLVIEQENSNLVKLRLNSAFLTQTSKYEYNLVTCSLRQKKINVFNVITKKLIRKISNDTGIILCMCLYYDDVKKTNYVITGSQDKAVRVWNVSTGECLKKLLGHLGPVMCLKLLVGKNLLASGGSPDCLIFVWDLLSFECLYTLYNLDDVLCLEHISESG